jgi:DNA-binding transcriptional ArsR family regulator
MTNPQKLARIFKALSVDTRVRMVQLLKDRALCVGALSARLDVTQGAVSQHLRILRDADLVVPEKRGYFIHYRLNEKTLLKWKNAVERLLGKEDKTEALRDLGNSREEGAQPCAREANVVRSRRNSSESPKSAHPSRSRNATAT